MLKIRSIVKEIPAKTTTTTTNLNPKFLGLAMDPQ